MENPDTKYVKKIFTLEVNHYAHEELAYFSAENVSIYAR